MRLEPGGHPLRTLTEGQPVHVSLRSGDFIGVVVEHLNHPGTDRHNGMTCVRVVHTGNSTHPPDAVVNVPTRDLIRLSKQDLYKRE